MNPAFVRANLRDETTREGDDFLLRERRSLADSGRRVVKEVELVRNGTARRWREDVRLYELDELRPLLASHSLLLRSTSGGFASEPASPTAPRLLLTVARG
jgi:hypothetical protein